MNVISSSNRKKKTLMEREEGQQLLVSGKKNLVVRVRGDMLRAGGDPKRGRWKNDFNARTRLVL